uniref:ATP synthase complex subunit 8 n=1 Tax=Prays oleae TaxID=627135 RepID=A0A0U1XUY0_9NEOP|nr:ATP synthase F0 subunit 8 [Prays oleae]AIY61493.1 ATP synthase F0 subunit 8 [Prays oleae]
MPQMMPMNWILSLIYFILLLMTFNIMNYYNYNNKMNNFLKINFKKKMLNWKW